MSTGYAKELFRLASEYVSDFEEVRRETLVTDVWCVVDDMLLDDIDKVIARLIADERERCAGIIDAANAHYAEQHEIAKATKSKSEVHDLQTMRIATAGLADLIRKGTT